MGPPWSHCDVTMASEHDRQLPASAIPPGRGIRIGAPAWRRVAATGVDYVVVVPWLVLLGGVGVSLRWAGVFIGEPHTWKGRLLAQLLVSMVLTIPVMLWLAWWEANRHSTPGKRVFGLRVDADDGLLSFRRGVLRSAFKVALPWELIHAAIWQTRGRDVTALAVVLVGLTYLVVGVQVVLLCRGGRPVHDRLAHTVVRCA